MELLNCVLGALLEDAVWSTSLPRTFSYVELKNRDIATLSDMRLHNCLTRNNIKFILRKQGDSHQCGAEAIIILLSSRSIHTETTQELPYSVLISINFRVGILHFRKVASSSFFYWGITKETWRTHYIIYALTTSLDMFSI